MCCLVYRVPQGHPRYVMKYHVRWSRTGASIPPEPRKHSLPVSEKHVSKSQQTIFPIAFSQKNFPLSKKVLMTFSFLVIDHYFRIFRFPDCKFPIYPQVCSSSLPLFLRYYSYTTTFSFSLQKFTFPSPLT